MSHELRALGLISLLLTACTSIPPATAPDATAENVQNAHQHDWLTQRELIATRLATSGDVEIQTRDDGALLLRLPAAEGFARDSTEPAPSLHAALARIAPALAAPAKVAVLVIGHTDSIGSEVYNLQLSIRRAEAVMETLRTLGVPLAHLSADGKGESESLVSNDTPEGRATNRRVELLLRPYE
jgi:outer membrane protein OmpA-like peptidoglycan-associated protein